MNIQQFDFSVNLLRALLWQHNEAARLESLLTQKQAWYDEKQRDFWNDWIVNVFDLRTADDFGISVWAIILGLPLTQSRSADDPDKPIWGFSIDDENFTNGNFANTSGFSLTTDECRILLFLRYFQLVTRATVPEINTFLAHVFVDSGTAYVSDGLNMTARYAFGFTMSDDFQTALTYFDLLPRPAGVFVDFVIVPDADGWGFGPPHFNFTNGNFYHA